MTKVCYDDLLAKKMEGQDILQALDNEYQKDASLKLKDLERNFLKLFGILLLSIVFYLPLISSFINWTVENTL